MGFDTIITNGRVVTAADTYASDLAISDGKITAIGQSLPRDNATKIIDAAGKYVLPGGIDVHTHLDMPFGGTNSADDFETGTRAAAFGGTTTLIDFAIQYKGQTLRTAFDTWMKKASGKAVCRLFVSLHHHRSCGRTTRRNECVSSAKASPASSCSWPIPAYSCSTMAASSRHSVRRQRMEAWSACTPKTAAPLT